MKNNIFNASDSDKLEYFDKLLQSDSTLQEKFKQYLQIKKSINISITDDTLEEDIDNIFEVLDGIDLSIYTDSCNSYYHYEFDVSEELLDSLFDEYEKKINIAISMGNYYQSLFIVLAIYKAIQKNPSVDDEYGIIYDYQDLLLDYLANLYVKKFEKLHDTQIDERKKILTLFIDNIDEKDGHKYFSDLYQYLIDSSEIAEYVIENINLFYIETQLHILHLLDDEEHYLYVAKQFYKENYFVARLLLQKLSGLNMYDEYVQIAKECFEKEPHYFIDIIIKVITPEKSQQFYIQLLRYATVFQSSFDDYKKLKKYVNLEELHQIHQQISKRHNVSYYITILEYEKYHEKILVFAKENLHVDLSNYVKILIDIYPQEILKIALSKCDLELKSYDRSRKNYKKICQNLSHIYKKSEIREEVHNYIRTLYNHKPRLPALQDELKKAKLV